MDNPPKIIKIESTHTPEVVGIKSEDVIYALKNSEKNDPEAIALYTKWYDQEYKRMENNEITNREFNWAVGELQEQAGYYEMAIATFNDLADSVYAEGDSVYVDMCNFKISEILKKNKSQK